MFNALVGKAVNATITATQKTKAYLATPEGKLAKAAVFGVYVGWALTAAAQRVMEEV
jgi:hypothetical protein